MQPSRSPLTSDQLRPRDAGHHTASDTLHYTCLRIHQFLSTYVGPYLVPISLSATPFYLLRSFLEELYTQPRTTAPGAAGMNATLPILCTSQWPPRQPAKTNVLDLAPVAYNRSTCSGKLGVWSTFQGQEVCDLFKAVPTEYLRPSFVF